MSSLLDENDIRVGVANSDGLVSMEVFMFGIKTLAAAAIVAVSACSVASAQSDVERQWELLLSGSGGSDKDFESNSFNANAQVGYYFTEQWQLNVRQTLGFSDTEGGGSSWVGATRLGVDYHFDFGQDQRWVPFVGAELGYLYGDDVDDTFAAGPEAGLKVYVNDTTFIYGSVLYEFLFDSGDDVDSQLDDGQFVYALGVGFRW